MEGETGCNISVNWCNGSDCNKDTFRTCQNQISNNLNFKTANISSFLMTHNNKSFPKGVSHPQEESMAKNIANIKEPSIKRKNFCPKDALLGKENKRCKHAKNDRLKQFVRSIECEGWRQHSILI